VFVAYVGHAGSELADLGLELCANGAVLVAKVKELIERDGFEVAGQGALEGCGGEHELVVAGGVKVIVGESPARVEKLLISGIVRGKRTAVGHANGEVGELEDTRGGLEVPLAIDELFVSAGEAEVTENFSEGGVNLR